MKSIICTLATMLLVAVLAGCGQSGPLYVPGDPSSIQTTPTTASDEEENDNGEDDDSQR
jgi:predicted small lipoprotein YifL